MSNIKSNRNKIEIIIQIISVVVIYIAFEMDIKKKSINMI